MAKKKEKKKRNGYHKARVSENSDFLAFFKKMPLSIVLNYTKRRERSRRIQRAKASSL